MIVAIHQPHYFPWLGYFDKMVKSDAFVLLDEVQFEKGSQMIRNKVVDSNGCPKYITISANTDGFLDRKYKDLQIKNLREWTGKQLNQLKNYYRKAQGFEEVYPLVEGFLKADYDTVCEWTCASIEFLCKLLNIQTPRILQSSVVYDRSCSKSDLVLEICKSLNADVYFSGRGGSVNYLDKQKFLNNKIQIEFQDFEHPIYKQKNAEVFLPGVSTLDALFNCGIEGTKQLIWGNARN